MSKILSMAAATALAAVFFVGTSPITSSGAYARGCCKTVYKPCRTRVVYKPCRKRTYYVRRRVSVRNSCGDVIRYRTVYRKRTKMICR